MENSNIQKYEKPIHPNANALLEKYTSDISAEILATARILANTKGDEVVLSSHIKEARNMLLKTPQSAKDRWYQLLITMSAVILGVSTNGLVSELVREPIIISNTLIYFVLSLVSIVLIVVALFRESHI